MEKCVIHLARREDYENVEVIMKQVQDMHVEWRPDIYKTAETVLPRELFLEAVEDGTFVVADV